MFPRAKLSRVSFYQCLSLYLFVLGTFGCLHQSINFWNIEKISHLDKQYQNLHLLKYHCHLIVGLKVGLPPFNIIICLLPLFLSYPKVFPQSSTRSEVSTSKTIKLQEHKHLKKCNWSSIYAYFTLMWCVNEIQSQLIWLSLSISQAQYSTARTASHEWLYEHQDESQATAKCMTDSKNPGQQMSCLLKFGYEWQNLHVKTHEQCSSWKCTRRIAHIHNLEMIEFVTWKGRQIWSGLSSNVFPKLWKKHSKYFERFLSLWYGMDLSWVEVPTSIQFITVDALLLIGSYVVALYLRQCTRNTLSQNSTSSSALENLTLNSAHLQWCIMSRAHSLYILDLQTKLCLPVNSHGPSTPSFI
jgi:hypothetical protein